MASLVLACLVAPEDGKFEPSFSFVVLMQLRPWWQVGICQTELSHYGLYAQMHNCAFFFAFLSSGPSSDFRTFRTSCNRDLIAIMSSFQQSPPRYQVKARSLYSSFVLIRIMKWRKRCRGLCRPCCDSVGRVCSRATASTKGFQEEDNHGKRCEHRSHDVHVRLLWHVVPKFQQALVLEASLINTLFTTGTGQQGCTISIAWHCLFQALSFQGNLCNLVYSSGPQYDLRYVSFYFRAAFLVQCSRSVADCNVTFY